MLNCRQKQRALGIENWQVLGWIVFLMRLTLIAAGARGFDHICRLDYNTVFELVVEATTIPSNSTRFTDDHKVPVIAVTRQNEDNESLRKLQSGPMLRGLEQLSSNGTVLMPKLLARECHCGTVESEAKFFCPIAFDTCGFDDASTNGTFSDGFQPTCYAFDKRLAFVRTIWLFLVAFPVMLLVLMVTTSAGRTTVDFFVRLLYPRWNVHVANRIMRRNPNRANGMIRRYLVRREAYLERHLYSYTHARVAPNTEETSPTDEEKPTSLALKTRTYHPRQEDPNDDSQDELYAASCAICFVPLEAGDRVGALPCDHVFHVDCLKSWLSRRNICPLCQTPNIARPCWTESCEQPTIMVDTPSSPTPQLQQDVSDRSVVASTTDPSCDVDERGRSNLSPPPSFE